MSLRLQVADVSWRAGTARVLSQVTLEARAGELIALMGKNGAGKSTLLDVVAGLRRADAGEVRLNGRPLSDWEVRARARLVGHLPQAVRPDLPFLAGELVLMGRYPHTDRWFESDADRNAVERAMTRTGCWPLRDRAMTTLSGGERQRVLLAACFAQEAQVLLFDEPSTFLDVDSQLQCFALLREECDRGALCLAVTHDVNLALAYATRLVVLVDGHIAVDLPIEEAAITPGWLALFSSQLRLSRTATGQPWVSYT
jgi:iron complex transport system ATP-binding protein